MPAFFCVFVYGNSKDTIPHETIGCCLYDLYDCKNNDSFKKSKSAEFGRQFYYRRIAAINKPKNNDIRNNGFFVLYIAPLHQYSGIGIFPVFAVACRVYRLNMLGIIRLIIQHGVQQTRRGIKYHHGVIIVILRRIVVFIIALFSELVRQLR